MPEALTVLPANESALRWASEHAKTHLMRKRHRETFDQIMTAFKDARKKDQTFSATSLPIHIDGLHGNLEMHHNTEYSGFIITLGTIFIEEAYPDDGPNFDDGPVVLNITAPGVVPASMIDQYAGAYVNSLVQLPTALYPIIAGSIIRVVEQEDVDIIIRVAREK